MPHDHAQRRAALQSANELRSARSQLRLQVRARQVDVRDLLLDPPAVLSGMSLLEVLLMVRGDGRRSMAWQARIGRAAVFAGVNLLMPVERACLTSRVWCAENAPTVRVRRVAA